MSDQRIDAIVEGEGPRAKEVVIKNGSLGIGIFFQGRELVSAPGLLLAEAILRETQGTQAKNWLAMKSKA